MLLAAVYSLLVNCRGSRGDIQKFVVYGHKLLLAMCQQTIKSHCRMSDCHSWGKNILEWNFWRLYMAAQLCLECKCSRSDSSGWKVATALCHRFVLIYPKSGLKLDEHKTWQNGVPLHVKKFSMTNVANAWWNCPGRNGTYIDLYAVTSLYAYRATVHDHQRLYQSLEVITGRLWFTHQSHLFRI